MPFRYQCIHWYQFENDEEERILSYKCTALCYILGYIYIVQMANRRTGHVFALNMQNVTKNSSVLLVFTC